VTDRRKIFRFGSLIHDRYGTGSYFVTQWPGNSATRRPSWPDPVTLFYNELQMSTYVADKRLQWARGFASFYRCLAFARFWKVKFWRSFINCQYFNNDWTDFHKKIYIFISLSWDFFSKTGKTRVSHRLKMMTRWPGRERWPRWPNDPVTQWPSSMSDTRLLWNWVAIAQGTLSWQPSFCLLNPHYFFVTLTNV